MILFENTHSPGCLPQSSCDSWCQQGFLAAPVCAQGSEAPWAVGDAVAELVVMPLAEEEELISNNTLH